MRDYIPSYSDSLRADILPSYTDSLMHHGIKGMHWGVRRYQNSDGSLTAAGKSRYGSSKLSVGYKFGDITRNTLGKWLADAVTKNDMKQYENRPDPTKKSNWEQIKKENDCWDDICIRSANEYSKYAKPCDNAINEYDKTYDKYGMHHPKTEAAYEKAQNLAYNYGYDTGKKAAKKFVKEYDHDLLSKVIDHTLEGEFSRKEISEMPDDLVEKFARWNGEMERRQV